MTMNKENTEASNFSFAYNKVIYDEVGTSLDYEILENSHCRR